MPITSLLCWALLQAVPAPVLTVARGEDGAATLVWGAVPGAQRYAVQVRGGGEERRYEPVVVTDYTVYGLRNGVDYRCSVAAVVSGGQRSAESEPRTVRPTAEPDWETLRAAFASPHPTRSSNPFTMVHGQETEEELRAILHAAYDGGFQGVTLHPYNYADYLGPGQWSRWRILFDEASRLGLCVWQQDDRNYPSGFAGGQVTAAHPEFARSRLAECAKFDVDGPRAGYTLALGRKLAPAEELVALVAYGPDDQPVDLTGRTTWDVPAGHWDLCAVKSVRDRGPYIDFMNPAAVDAYLQAIYGATYAQFKPRFGEVFRGFFSDEAPVDFALWTPDALARFQAVKGYDLRPWLPRLLRQPARCTPAVRRARADWRDFVREQVSTVFFGRSQAWCHAHGISFIGHVIEDHRLDMRRLEFLDLPGFDHIFAQWYTPDPDVYWRQAKMASSVAHYLGRPTALVEHFAATGWRTGLSEAKRMMDWTTAMGFGQVVPCGLDTQDPPVWEVTPDFWLHGRNPQWPYFRGYQTCANRQTMLTRVGTHVAPVLVLDTTESWWPLAGAELGAPHGARDDLWKTLAALGRAQLDCDLLPYAVFTDPARCQFGPGGVTVGAETYQAVVLPPVECLPLAVARRLAEFAGPVAVGRWPSASVNGVDDAALLAAVEVLKGRAALKTEAELAGWLRERGVGDVLLLPAHPRTRYAGVNLQDWTPDLKGAERVLYSHRRYRGRDLYFFANTGAQSVSLDARLPYVQSRELEPKGRAELWEPADGHIAALGCVVPSALGGGVIGGPAGAVIPLDLAAGESVFVVFDPSGARTEVPRWAPTRLIELTPTGQQERVDPTAVWTKAGADGGYRLALTLPADWAAGRGQLRFGGATQVLTLRVNGHDAGYRFAEPYRFDVGALLKPGANELVVRRVERYGMEAKPVGTYVDDPDLKYTGAWNAGHYAPTYNGTRHFTNQPGAAAEFTFRGTDLTWIGERDDNRGKAEVFLDGKSVAVVDTWNGGGAERPQSVLWHVEGLAPGEHRLRVVCRGEHAAGSRDNYITVDALIVAGATGAAGVPWTSAVLVEQ